MNNEDLDRLLEKTDDFIQEIYDYVKPLNSVYVLHDLYEFKVAIDKEKKGKSDD